VSEAAMTSEPAAPPLAKHGLKNRSNLAAALFLVLFALAIGAVVIYAFGGLLPRAAQPTWDQLPQATKKFNEAQDELLRVIEQKATPQKPR
jgi:hypothetical protein